MYKFAVFCAVLWGISACGGGAAVLQPDDAAGARERSGATSPKLGRGLTATLLGRVPAGTFGPYLARRGDARLLAWAEMTKGKRVWKSLRVNAEGAPMAEPQLLGAAAEQVGFVTLDPTTSGYALLTSSQSAQAHVIDAWLLDSEGKRQSGPERVAEIEEELLWVDWVVTKAGNMALWAVRSEQGRGDRADIFAKKLGTESAITVAKEVRAWQTAVAGDTVGVAVVRATGTPLGPVDLVRITGEGRVSGTTSVTPAASAEPDLDMVAVGNQFLLAWSDRAQHEPRVVFARVDAAGKLSSQPASVTQPRGDQALIRLVPPADDSRVAYLVWEELLERRPGARSFRVAALTEPKGGSASGSQVSSNQAQLSFDSLDGGVPELMATPTGLSALTLARPCRRGAACQEEPVTTFVELDQSLAVKTSTPLLLGPLGGEVAPLAWGLSCSAKGCLTLAATEGAPADVYAVRFDRAESSWQPAAGRVERGDPPRLKAVTTIARVEDPLAQVAFEQTKSGALGAFITYFDPATPWQRLPRPATDGRFDPPRATLYVQKIGSSAPPTQISFRARSLGGVALAADTSLGETALGWTALDNQIPQVFVTVVDDDGKRLRQQMLTRNRGEKSDVALARVADGWVVAWVDERDGDPEVYAAKVNRMLQRVGPDKRITRTPGACSGVTLLASGGHVLLAWSDAAADPNSAQEHVHVAKLSGADASLVGTPTVVDQTGHTHSPALARHSRGAALGYLGVGANGQVQVRLALLDADGGSPTTPVNWLNPELDATAVGLACEAERCRVVAVGDVAGRASVVATLWSSSRTAPGEGGALLSLGRPAIRSARLPVIGDALLVPDHGGASGSRVRRVVVEWQ